MLNWQEYITVDPTVSHGQTCIRGTRIPVSVILDNLAEDVSKAEPLRNYPALTPDALAAALAYAAELTQ